MKYSRLSFQYMKRRWLYVLLYSILPAIVFAFTSSPVSLFSAIIALRDDKGMKFLDVWMQSTELGWGAFFLILSGLLLVIFVSAFSGLMERDMRLGDLTNKKFFNRVNNNFLIVLKVFVVFVLFLELYGVINASLVYLWRKVFDTNAIYLTFAICSVAVVTIVSIAIASLGILWIPTMIMTGLNMRKSLVESLQLIKGKVFKMIWNIMLPAIPLYAIAMVVSYFDLTVLSFVVELILNLFIIGYYPVLMFVSYFDATGTDREDLRKKIWEVNK